MDQYKCKEMVADSVDESHRRPRKRSLLYCLAVVATSLVFVSFAFGLFAMQSNINHLAAVVRDQAETLSETSSNIHHLASRVSELSSNVDHLAATVKDQAEMLSVMSSKIHHLEGELSSNVDRLATTVEDHADKLSEMERQLAANEETQRNLSVHHSALESRVASIGQQLVEDETNYHEYLLNLQRNLTEMLKDELSVARYNDSFLESLQQQVGAVNGNLEQLGTKISRPMNIFSRCKVDQRTCDIGDGGNGDYWKACSTDFLPETEAGYFTIGKRCLYNGGSRRYSEVLTPYRKNGRVRCDCDVTYPGADSAGQRRVEDPHASCLLSITRCPTSVTLLPLHSSN